MSKICEVSVKRVMFGNNVSKALNITKRRFDANDGSQRNQISHGKEIRSIITDRFKKINQSH